MESRKYKVLIADDEYWTREKLCRMIQWEEYSLICQKPACDGEDVLRKMEEDMPDILITDINMPYIDGVELLQIVQKKYPDVITFVISGYDDFEYVKESFLAGSVNYLLKPVSKIDLVHALSKALEKISEKQSRSLELQKAASLLQDREFSRLLEKQDMPFTPNVTMNSKVDFAAASLMLVKIHNMRELTEMYQYDQNLLSWMVKKELRKLAGKRENMFVFNHIYRSNEFLIVTEAEKNELDSLAGKIVTQFGRETKAPVTVAVSEQSYSMDSLHRAYIQAIACLVTRRFIRENQILFCRKQADVQEQKIETRFDDAQMQELKQMLRKNQPQEVKQYLRRIFEEDVTRRGWSYLEVRQSVRKILNMIQNEFASDMNAEDAVALENLADLADKVVEQLNVKYLCEVLEEAVDFVVSIRQGAVSDTTRGLVKQAAAYIDEHFFEELTLSSLAEQFHVENSYFSRLFRQETGENVMLYIAKTRIRRAQEYMKEEGKSLTEIAFLAGYDDYTYFNRVFRKITGKSPREYRAGLKAGN